MELEQFFRSKSAAGQQALSKMASTFKALCSLADFSQDESRLKKVGIGVKDSGSPSRDSGAKPSAGIAININVQLTLPETTNEKVYESIFHAMKRHIINADTDD